MQIKFNNIQVTEVKYQVDTFDKDIARELSTSLDIKTLMLDEDKKRFAIEFRLALENTGSDKIVLKLKAVAHFSTQEDINENFMQSHFVKMNAPAIAFPYVRSFISNLTLNSGYNPIVLPTINFVKFIEERQTRVISNL